jgi:DNA-directed RNA polymerase specialized sigma24 family protein
MTAEHELIGWLKAKEERGFDMLYEGYGACLYLYIFRRVGNGQLAEDLLEESFIYIWQHIDEYDASKGSLLNWLLTITRATAIDRTGLLAY